MVFVFSNYSVNHTYGLRSFCMKVIARDMKVKKDEKT